MQIAWVVLQMWAHSSPPAPHQMLTTPKPGDHSHRPLGAQGLMKLTPVTHPLPSSSASQKTAGSDQVSRDPPPWPDFLKMLCWNPWGASGFSGYEPPCLLAWPCNKTFLCSKLQRFSLALLCARHTSFHERHEILLVKAVYKLWSADQCAILTVIKSSNTSILEVLFLDLSNQRPPFYKG